MKPLCFLFVSVFVNSCAQRGLASEDLYKNFADLSLHKEEGRDFVVEFKERSSKICVLAIHGGRIEEGSVQLAREIAGKDLSYYFFIAQQKSNNRDLHVTSIHFDDPRALSIVQSAESCLSIHGFKEDQKDVLCIGGENIRFRDQVVTALTQAAMPFAVESPCERFGGNTAENIVNRSQKGGVQIEISTHLRQQFLTRPELLTKTAKVLHSISWPYE